MHTQHLQHLIERLWQRQYMWHRLGWLALTPASAGFSALVRGRNLFYNHGLFSTTHVPLNIVSVGNLTVGGTGKTPMTLWLAQAFQARGYRVGILTRGYKGTKTGLTVVGTAGRPLVTPDEAGDEAVMMAQRFSGVVIAGRDRVAAATRAHHEFDLNVAILDDGFQYRRLHRDVDILLMSAQANDNHWVLPAGPFRESVTAALRADILVFTKSPTEETLTPTFPFTRNEAVTVFSGDLVPTAFVSAVNGDRQHTFARRCRRAARACRHWDCGTSLVLPDASRVGCHSSLRFWNFPIITTIPMPIGSASRSSARNAI